jgi:tetratricopeptide (TPR) repeat protein
MSKIYLLIILLNTAFLLPESLIKAEKINSVHDDVTLEQLLEQGIEAFYNTDWIASTELFNKMKMISPDDPRPYFFESMMPFLEYFLVNQTEELADQFLTQSDKAVALSEKRLKSSPSDTTMVLLLSGLHGYRGLVAADQNKHRIALSSGLTGFNYTRQLLSLGGDRPDARIGRGMFYYMVGSIPSGMRWASNIVGLRASIEDGFDELKRAAETDSYISNDAKMMLMYLYQKEGRLEESLYYAVQLTQKLPDNVIFLYKKAEILENLDNMEGAFDVYKEIVRKNNPSLKNVTDLSEKKINVIEKLTLNY